MFIFAKSCHRNLGVNLSHAICEFTMNMTGCCNLSMSTTWFFSPSNKESFQITIYQSGKLQLVLYCQMSFNVVLVVS